MSSILTTAQIRMLMLSPAGRLTSASKPASKEFPNYKRLAQALARPSGRRTVALFVPAISRTSLGRAHIGKATSSIREDWRPLVSRGALPCLFCVL